MASENVRARIKLQSVLAKKARELSGIFHESAPEQADWAFCTKPIEIIESFKDLAFAVGKEGAEKTFIVDNWALFESYPVRDGIQHDEKRWRAIGHVEENPRVKATITVIVYGQNVVGEHNYEILVITDAIIKDDLKIIGGLQPFIAS